MISVPHPSKTLLFVLVVGAAFAAIPYAIDVKDDADDGLRYEATAFDPESEAHVLAHRSSAVENLTAAADEPDNRKLLDRAADGETVSVPANHSRLGYLAHEDGYAVYRGEYYLVNGTERNETVTVRLEARTTDQAMDDLAVPYESASPGVKRVVDRGNATITRNESDRTTGNESVGNESGEFSLGPDVPPVVERDGTYYAIGLVNPLSILLPFAQAAVVRWLQRLGNVYAGGALGVLGATAFTRSRSALTLRSATVVAAFTAAVHGVLVVASPTPSNPIAAGSSLLDAFVLAGALGVGVALRPPRSGRRMLAAAGIVMGAIFTTAATNAAMVGSILALFTSLIWIVLSALVVSPPLLALGYVHGVDQ